MLPWVLLLVDQEVGRRRLDLISIGLHLGGMIYGGRDDKWKAESCRGNCQLHVHEGVSNFCMYLSVTNQMNENAAFQL